MTYPKDIVRAFADAERAVRQSAWFDDSWGCCSGLWQTDRYPDTVVLRLTRRNWTSIFPPTLHEGGDIQYVAWVDEKLLRQSTVRFEMHVFAYPAGVRARKKDFTDPFRARCGERIKAFGHHDTDRGHAIPYAGAVSFSSREELTEFLLQDFSSFASLSGCVDECLAAAVERGAPAVGRS